MLRAVDCQAMTDTQWDALFGGSLLRWLELKHSSLFQYMFESHVLSPAHRDEVNQTYNQMAEFNTFQQLLQHNNSDLPSVSSFPPNLSPEQLRSADCLSGDDQEDSSDSSGALLHLDLNTLEENWQDTYAFLQISSPLGMDHPESFMDPDTDIIRGSFSDSEVSNPSPTYFMKCFKNLSDGSFLKTSPLASLPAPHRHRRLLPHLHPHLHFPIQNPHVHIIE